MCINVILMCEIMICNIINISNENMKILILIILMCNEMCINSNDILILLILMCINDMKININILMKIW